MCREKCQSEKITGKKCNNTLYFAGYFCEKHSCDKLNCLYHKSKNNDYCDYHKCQVPNCDARPMRDNRFCCYHCDYIPRWQCKVCDKEIDMDIYKYFCVDHKCLLCDLSFVCIYHGAKNNVRYSAYAMCIPKDIRNIIIDYL